MNVGTDVVSLLIGITAVLGNGLVCLVMRARKQYFRSSTNHLILHQSVIDFLSGWVYIVFLFVPAAGEIELPPNFLGELMCRVRRPNYIQWSLFITSTFNLVVISLERYLATCHPIRHRNSFSKKTMKVGMLGSWLLGFGINLNSVYLNQLDYKHMECRFQQNSRVLQALLVTLQTISEYIVPVLIHIFAYTKMWLMIRSRMTDPSNPADDKMNRAKRNILVTLFFTSVFFAICWGPIEVFFLYNNITGTIPANTLYTVLTCITAFNACINPVVYCFHYDHFRRHLKELMLNLVPGNNCIEPLEQLGSVSSKCRTTN